MVTWWSFFEYAQRSYLKVIVSIDARVHSTFLSFSCKLRTVTSWVIETRERERERRKKLWRNTEFQHCLCLVFGEVNFLRGSSRGILRGSAPQALAPRKEQSSWFISLPLLYTCHQRSTSSCELFALFAFQGNSGLQLLSKELDSSD